MQERGCQVDARLLAFAAGLEQAAQVAASQQQQGQRTGGGQAAAGGKGSTAREFGLAVVAAAGLWLVDRLARGSR